jgi:hypothetical protein
MLFLNTRSGLIAERAIDLIESLCIRPTGNFHRIEYHVGNEARETRATEEAVQDFLEASE